MSEANGVNLTAGFGVNFKEINMQPKLTNLFIGRRGDAATGEQTIRADFSNDRHYEVVIRHPANAEQVAKAMLEMAHMIGRDPLLTPNVS